MAPGARRPARGAAPHGPDPTAQLATQGGAHYDAIPGEQALVSLSGADHFFQADRPDEAGTPPASPAGGVPLGRRRASHGSRPCPS